MLNYGKKKNAKFRSEKVQRLFFNNPDNFIAPVENDRS